MARRFVTTSAVDTVRLNAGIVAVLGDLEPRILAKTMFELSRDGSDMTTHFDSELHTLDAIAAGIPGHIALTCREIDDRDLPTEQALRGSKTSLRNAWEDTGTAIVVNMDKARIINMGR